MDDIPALVQSLRSGRRTAQLHAARQLAELTEFDDAASAATCAGAVPVLTQLLSSSSVVLRGVAARALSNTISGQAEPSAAVVEAGGVPLLLECLTSSDDTLLMPVACLVANLMHSCNRCRMEAGRALAAGGAIPTLVSMLDRGSDQVVIRGVACRVLQNFADCVEFKDAILAAGAVPILVQCLSDRDTVIRQAAVGALSNLSGVSCECASAVADIKEAIPSLAQLLFSSEEEIRDRAVTATANLSGLPQHRGTLAAAGAIQGLARYLAEGRRVQGVLFLGVGALYRLCQGNPERSRLAVEAGAVPALQRLRDSSKDEHEQEVIALALAALLEPPAAAPRPPAPRVCAAPGCGATRGLKRCGGCGAVRYCSEACRNAHWRAHKAECRRLQVELAASTGQRQLS